jgi:hypothetical protein
MAWDTFGIWNKLHFPSRCNFQNTITTLGSKPKSLIRKPQAEKLLLNALQAVHMTPNFLYQTSPHFLTRSFTMSLSGYVCVCVCVCVRACARVGS